MVQYAINRLFLARVRRMDSPFFFDPSSYARSVARLNDATQSLQSSVDALKRAVSPPSAPKPSLVVNIPRAAAAPSQPYDSDDEPPTPPGVD